MKSWVNRERQYTTRYSALMYVALMAQWRKAYKQYKETQTVEVDPAILEVVYRKLYVRVSEQEAIIAIDSIKNTKDIFSAIANIFSANRQPLTVRFIKDLMQQYFDVYILQRLARVNQTTLQYIQEAIQYGVDNGFSTLQMAKHMRARATELSKDRAVKIARTEVTTAANRAQLLTHESSPFEYTKAWLPVVDDKTRDGHIKMDPKVYIDLWDMFNVQDRNGNYEEMIAPGDPEAGASNVANCRCVLLYKVKKDANGRPIRK